jgi:hypothetical protein
MAGRHLFNVFGAMLLDVVTCFIDVYYIKSCDNFYIMDGYA